MIYLFPPQLYPVLLSQTFLQYERWRKKIIWGEAIGWEYGFADQRFVKTHYKYVNNHMKQIMLLLLIVNQHLFWSLL